MEFLQMVYTLYNLKGDVHPFDSQIKIRVTYATFFC